MDVATLVQQMHDNLVEIHQTIATVESSEHHAKLEELEKKRDGLLASLREAFDEEHAKIRDQRVEESMKIADVRRQEDEERERRRLAEDAELESKRASEDETKLKKLDDEMDVVEDELDEQMDEIEKAAHSEIEAGEQKIRELEDKRREINRLIDEKLQQPLLSLPVRKRTRYARRASRARARSSPTPPKVASDEAPAEAVKAAAANAPPAPEAEAEAPVTESRSLAVESPQADSSADAPAEASSSDVPAVVPTETVTEAPKDLPADTPADAPVDAHSEASTATPADISAADAPDAISTDTPTATSKDLPDDAPTDAQAGPSTDSPAEASSAAPADVPAAAPADASTDIPSDAPKDVPNVIPTDAPVDAPASSSADAPVETPSEASADVPTAASTDSPADVPSEVSTNAPTSTQTDLPDGPSTDASEEAPKEASTDAPGDVAAEAVDVKSVEAAKPGQEEEDSAAVETSAVKGTEASKTVEEVASEPVKHVDGGAEEITKAVTETPAEAETLEKSPQDIAEPAAASEDAKPEEASDKYENSIPEDAPNDLIPEPKFVADETDATEADPATGSTEAPAAEVPVEATISEARPTTENAIGAKDDAPLKDTPTTEVTEASTSDSHAPLEESLSKDTAAAESPSDKDAITNDPETETISQEADKEDASDAEATVDASPAAPEAISENAAEAASENASEEPSAKVPGEAAAKDVSVDSAPAEATEVTSPEATAKDVSEEPDSSDEPKADSALPEISAKEAAQAVPEEAATPEVDSSKAAAKDAPVDAAIASAAPQPEATSPEAATPDTPAANLPAEASEASPQKSSEKLAEEAVAKDAPDATTAASEIPPATPEEVMEKVSEAADTMQSLEAASASHVFPNVPEEASEKAVEGASAKSVSEVIPEDPAEVTSEKGPDADIPFPSSTAGPEEASEKPAEKSAVVEASDAGAPVETSPSEIEENPKVIDEGEINDSPVVETSVESRLDSPEVASPKEISEKVTKEPATKDSALVVPEGVADDAEATAKNASAVESSAETPVETAQANDGGAEEKAAEESAAKEAPVADSLQETPSETPQTSQEDASTKASTEVDEKSARDSKTSAVPAEEKALDDKIPSEVNLSGEATAETTPADDPAHEKLDDNLPAVSQPVSPPALQGKIADVPEVSAAASLDPSEASTASQETPAISKPAVSPLAVHEDLGIGQQEQASIGEIDKDLQLALPSGSTSLKTDDQPPANDEPAVAEMPKASGDAVVRSHNVDSDGALSDATEGPNSPRVSLNDSDDSYTGESAAKPLEGPEVLSTATKEEPSQSPIPVEASAVAPGKTPDVIEAETQPGTSHAAVPDADERPTEESDVRRLSTTEAKAQEPSVEKPEPQLSNVEAAGVPEAAVISEIAPTGNGTPLTSKPIDKDDSADESEGERDAPAAAKEGPVAATDPISDSPAPVAGQATATEELATEIAPSDETGEAHASKGTLNVPSIRLNEEKDEAMAPGTPIENINAEDTKTADATEHTQPSGVESVPEATGLASASGQDVDLVPARQSSRSPLPVENTTVDGQEALFDDDSVATDNEEDTAGDKIKESIVSYDPEEDEGPPTARLPVDGITRFRGNEVKSYEHLRGADGEKIDLDQEQSRHAPSDSPDSSSELGDFTPRDVTNVTWRDRSESVNSYSTMSSTPSSPVQSILHSDRHEPAGRDAWPASLGAASRSRGYSQLTNNTSVGSTTDDFDPFRYDANNMVTKAGGIPSPPLPQSQDYFRPRDISQPREFYQAQESGQPREMPQAKEATSPREFPLAAPESPAAANRGSLAGSPMFAKLRGMFEGQQSANNQSDANPPRSGSPTRSRPPSALFAPVGRERSSSLRKSVNAGDDSGEQSSLLGANEGASGMGRH